MRGCFDLASGKPSDQFQLKNKKTLRVDALDLAKATTPINPPKIALELVYREGWIKGS